MPQQQPSRSDKINSVEGISRKKKVSSEDPKVKLIKALSSMLPSYLQEDQDEGYCGLSDIEVHVNDSKNCHVGDEGASKLLLQSQVDIRVKKLKVGSQIQEAEVQTLDMISLRDDFESKLVISQPIKRFRLDAACQKDDHETKTEVKKLKVRIENVGNIFITLLNHISKA